MTEQQGENSKVQYPTSEGDYPHPHLITSDQSNLTKGRIAVADGRFNRIRVVAPMCTPVGFLGPTRVHIPNGMSIGSAVIAQLTAGRQSLYSKIGCPLFPQHSTSTLPQKVKGCFFFCLQVGHLVYT